MRRDAPVGAAESLRLASSYGAAKYLRIWAEAVVTANLTGEPSFAQVFGGAHSAPGSYRLHIQTRPCIRACKLVGIQTDARHHTMHAAE